MSIRGPLWPDRTSPRPLLADRPVPERHRAEGNRQHAADDHRNEHAGPSPAVGDPPDAASRDRRSKDVAEESGESRRRTSGLLGHEVERVQADDHDRTVNEEADRD